MREPERGHPILLFDAECSLCIFCVRWLLSHDRIGALHLAPLNSSLADNLLRESFTKTPEATAVFYAKPGDPTPAVRSAAILEALATCGFRNRWVRFAQSVPAPVRDGAYRFIARCRRLTPKSTRPAPWTEERWAGRFLR